MSTYVPRLPRNVADGTEILDRYGNIWKYSATDNAWISIGAVTTPNNVTESVDGLVTPDIYNKLRILSASSNNKNLYQSLKIIPGIDAYWYYFRSSDKLFKFKPESESALRIELDQGRLYQILAKASKRGPRGETGPKGIAGSDGSSVSNACDVQTNEPSYLPSFINDNRLDFAIYTPAPLVLNGIIPLPNNHIPTISVRVYKASYPNNIKTTNQLTYMRELAKHSFNMESSFEQTKNLLIQKSLGVKSFNSDNVCDIALSEVIATDAVYSEPLITIDLDVTDPDKVNVESSIIFNLLDAVKTASSVRYDKKTGIACGSIYLLEGASWEGDYAIRSRQRGPDGEKGDPGYRTIKLDFTTIDSTNIEATSPIINVRYDRTKSTLYTANSNLLAEPTVDKVLLLADSSGLTSDNALKSIFAAAQMVIQDDKYVYRYIPELEDTKVPELVLAQWEPLPGCRTKRHYDRHKFNWVPETDDGSCTTGHVWYGANNTRKSVYPWTIVQSKTPPNDTCCQEDFFYCPNIQDVPCPGTTLSDKPADSTRPNDQSPSPTVTTAEFIDKFSWYPTQPYYQYGENGAYLTAFVGLNQDSNVDTTLIKVSNSSNVKIVSETGTYPTKGIYINVVPKNQGSKSVLDFNFSQGAFYNGTIKSVKVTRSLTAPANTDQLVQPPTPANNSGPPTILGNSGGGGGGGSSTINAQLAFINSNVGKSNRDGTNRITYMTYRLYFTINNNDPTVWLDQKKFTVTSANNAFRSFPIGFSAVTNDNVIINDVTNGRNSLIAVYTPYLDFDYNSTTKVSDTITFTILVDGLRASNGATNKSNISLSFNLMYVLNKSTDPLSDSTENFYITT